MKRILCLLMIALMTAALLSGCSAGVVPAAKIGDMTISVTELENMYQNNSTYASYYGYSLTDDEGIEAFQDYLLEMLVESRVKQYEAEQAGIELTDEEKAEAKATAESNYNDTYQTFVDAAENAGASDVKAYANSLLTDALSKNKTTVKKMKAQYLEDAEAELRVKKHKTQLLEGVELSQEELASMYDEELAAQKEAFDADPSAYFTQSSYYSYGYDYIPLYMPEGFFRVRHILVADEETAKEVLAKLNAGEDFETLLSEYNTDPGMATYPDGYLVGEGASFVEAFLNAALALENDGEISGVVESDYGFHIIKRVSTEAAGAIPYDEVQADFESYAKTLYESEYYNDLVAGWMAEDGLVTYYEENYRSIGKAA